MNQRGFDIFCLYCGKSFGRERIKTGESFNFDCQKCGGKFGVEIPSKIELDKTELELVISLIIDNPENYLTNQKIGLFCPFCENKSELVNITEPSNDWVEPVIGCKNCKRVYELVGDY